MTEKLIALLVKPSAHITRGKFSIHIVLNIYYLYTLLGNYMILKIHLF